jgi:hypothetical protein
MVVLTVLTMAEPGTFKDRCRWLCSAPCFQRTPSDMTMFLPGDPCLLPPLSSPEGLVEP